jgi:transposase
MSRLMCRLRKSAFVLDEKGGVVFEGKTAAEPAVLVDLIRSKAPGVVRIGLETGATAPWLLRSLTAAGLPAICIDARQANAVLSMRPHERRALLATRHRLVTIRTELDAQLRGLLKTFGLVVGPGNTDVLIRKAEAFSEGLPRVRALVSKLAEVRRHVVVQVAALDRDIRHLVRSDATLRRFVTVPGVGPITAVAFLSTIDDPHRFRHARDVGPYLGLTPTRYQSGETDRQGRISKCGDAFTRTCLYEAASVLLSKVHRFSPLKAWGMRLAKRIGGKKARIAVARKIAVILRCIWTDGTEFCWTRAERRMP